MPNGKKNRKPYLRKLTACTKLFLLAGIVWVVLSPILQAQKRSELLYKVGVQLGYNYGYSPSFQDAIQRFNLARPDFNHAPLRHGFYVGINGSYGVTPQLYVYAQVFYRRIQSRAKNFVYEVGTSLNGLELAAGAHIYPFAVSKHYSTGFAGSFYLNAYAGIAYVTPRAEQEDELFVLRGEQPFDQNIYTPVFGGGLGVDLYTANRFSFSPELMVSYYLPFNVDNLTALYTNSSLIEGEERGGALYIQVGIHLRYHSTSKGIRQRKKRL